MEGSSKRGSVSKKKTTRPKVRSNLGEPHRFHLQDEADPIPPYQPQPFSPQPFQNEPFPNQPFQYQPFQNQPYQTQSYQNQPFTPPFQTQPYQTQPFQHQPFQNQPFQTQQSQNYCDPLEDNTVIHQFAREYREPQQDDDDDDSEPFQEEEQEEEDDEEVDIVPISGGRRPWTSDEEVALIKAFLHISENKKHSNQQKRDMFWRRVITHFSKLPGSTERNMDQMTSKWGDLNRTMSKFNACFIQLVFF